MRLARILIVSALVAACASDPPVVAPMAEEGVEVSRTPLAAALGASRVPDPEHETLEVLGLQRPVAVVHDPASDVYLISNAPADDQPGFITSLLPDGAVEAVRWIDGAHDGVVLHHPAGMALVQTRLVVADGDHLRVFDRETGAPRGEVLVPGATALRDVAPGPRGAIYVTDAGVEGSRSLGAVYRISRRGTVSIVAKSSVLGRPTGLVCVGSTVWIAATEPDKFYGIDPSGDLTHGPTLPGDVAGLSHVAGRVFLSSPASRAIYGGPIEGPFVPLVVDVNAPGDVGWDSARGRLLVPRADTHALQVYTLAPPSTDEVTTTVAPPSDQTRG